MNIESVKATNVIKKSKPSFSGHVLTKDVYGNDIYKFNLPNAPEGTKLEYVVRTPDGKGGFIAHQKVNTVDLKKGFESYVLYADDLNLTNNSVLGYKITVPNKIYKDNGVCDNNGFACATPLSKANPSRPRVMQHFFIDAFNVKNDKGLHTKRTHFNILGGTLNSVNEKVQEMADAGITAFLSPPVFGQDNISSHGYWTTNPYQITNNLGNIKDFKKLLLNMFSKDIRWTADGAFVNEGMEGIHVKDILRFGYESPFVHFFQTKDLDNLAPRFGILSKNSDVNLHTHIQLVNAPYKIVFEKTPNGYVEKSVKTSKVDPTKPTYIQVFDDRLASERQMSGDFIFNVYDKKDTGDNKEISNYRDSVQAYSFRVSAGEVEDNFKKYKEAKRIDKSSQFKNSLTKWKNFELVESNKDGGISLWVGNSDISKKRFVLPESSMYFSNVSDDLKPVVRAAQYQVQDDTVQIGKFWTNEVSRTFIEDVARNIGLKVNRDMSYEQAINSLVVEGKLPEAVKVIFEQEDGVSALDNILESDVFGEGRNYRLKNIKMPENVLDGVMSYPFEAIEFSPDLVSVFAYPHIKNLAITEDTIGKSRYEMYQMGDKYYNEIPVQYRETYKKMDNLLVNEFSQKTVSILRALEDKLQTKLLVDENNFTTVGKEIYSLIAPDIVKFLTVSALAPKVEPDYKENILFYNPKELNKYDLNKLNLQYEVSPTDTAVRLIEQLKSGLDNISSDKQNLFVLHLANRLNGVDSDTYNVARLIIEKLEAGLDWRIDASKDVGDTDSVEDGKFTFDDNKKSIMKFWQKFNKAVREYNPNAYTIGELTNWSSWLFPEFLEKTGFTTISDYDYFYSTIPALFGQNDEGKNFKNSDDKKLVDVFQDKFFSDKDHLGYFDSGMLDHINFAHRFVGNHDKPRILHLLAVDVNLFNTNKAQAVSDAVKRGFSSSAEFNKLTQPMKNDLYRAVDTLADGIYHKNGVEKEYDGENFGVRPFDFIIEDIIAEAIENSVHFKQFATKESNKQAVNLLKANILQEILKPAMSKYRSVWFMMNALPGTPTNYAGDEFGMTGWEYPCKNEKQENRNAIKWHLLTNPNYSFIKDFKDKIDAISKIRKKEGASALVNGTTIMLKHQNVENNDPVLTLYRYNDKSDAICLLHNNGYGQNVEACGHDVHLNKIDLTGLPNGLAVGTVYVDALNPVSKYKVTNPYEIKKVNDNNVNEIQEDINLGNVGLILLRENDFNNKKMSFKGSITNTNVELANLKYNFSFKNN